MDIQTAIVLEELEDKEVTSVGVTYCPNCRTYYWINGRELECQNCGVIFEPEIKHHRIDHDCRQGECRNEYA